MRFSIFAIVALFVGITSVNAIPTLNVTRYAAPSDIPPPSSTHPRTDVLVDVVSHLRKKRWSCEKSSLQKTARSRIALSVGPSLRLLPRRLGRARGLFLSVRQLLYRHYWMVLIGALAWHVIYSSQTLSGGYLPDSAITACALVYPRHTYPQSTDDMNSHQYPQQRFRRQVHVSALLDFAYAQRRLVLERWARQSKVQGHEKQALCRCSDCYERVYSRFA